MKHQGGEGIQAPSTAPAGGTVDVSVGPNDSSVEVSMGSADDVTSFDVSPEKTVTIPVPNAPGSIISVSVGEGFAKRIIYIEIVAPSP